jgi:CBS domain-containing protein
VKSTTLARDLMVRPVRRVTSRASVRDAAEFLVRHGISGAPVEDEHGRWVGCFSLRDIAGAMVRSLRNPQAERSLEAREPAQDPDADTLEALQVRDLMTPGMVTVFPDSTLSEIVRTLVSAGVHRVFVIHQESGALEGVITTMDVLRHLKTTRTKVATLRG